MIDNENLGGITHPNTAANHSPTFLRRIKPPHIFFIMMRINLKMAWFCLCGLVLFIMLSLWSRCGFTSPDWNKPTRVKYDRLVDHAGDTQVAKEIDCYINNEYTVSCRKEGDEVYLPFTFLHRYFEVYGKLATYDDGVERFEWSHSYGTVYHPRGKYDPRGVFMYFEKYNVEARERVKCISSSSGVPVSRQWGNQGYYYPTQIAQFGLSHYSKNLTKPEPQRKIIEDGEKEVTSWLVPAGCFLNRTLDVDNYILKFSTPENRNNAVIRFKLDHVMDFIMTIHLKLEKNSSIIVTLQDREKKESFHLHYNTSDMFIFAQDQHIYHGLGPETKWLRITRDLVVDLQKGLLFMNRLKRKISRSKLKVTGISLQGEGCIDNITFSSSEHIAHFYDAANWFVRNQNPTTGGWSNPVRRKVASGFDELEPGWYSAMGQGHAISVLMRAYHHSGGETQYLQAAIAGLRPFRIPSYQGGVLATFLGKYGWYEEYPTHPASFVLNGFIYSLLGLYDLMTIAPVAHAKEAALLFKQGMVALKGMLLLYDTGSGTSYDLRHFTLGVAPNLARWDYHATHVNQLLLLATIDDADILDVTAKRWLGYLKGKRSAHN